MDRNSVNWQGPMPAIVTPFDERGAFDERALQQNIDLLMDRGATGIVIGGCTGEFWAMTLDERKQLMKLGVKAMRGRGTVIAGTGAIGVADAIALTRAAHDAGCDGGLVLPPYFVKLSDDEIFAHYEAISRAVDGPVMLYNIPGNAVNALTPALVTRLADLDTVVAVKESSGDWNNYYATAIAVQDRLRVFCGPSSVFGVPAVLAGADGTVDCFPNMWAPGGLDLFHAPRAGRIEEANRLQELGVKLTTLFTTGGRTLYPATKAAMELLGLPGGKLRPPLRPLGAEALAGLKQGLVELGLLEGAPAHRKSASFAR
jgi:dihydrodipicolinate synthase/N-acetylneuraminate lyase